MASPQAVWFDGAHNGSRSKQTAHNSWQPYEIGGPDAQWTNTGNGETDYVLSPEEESMNLQYWKLDGPIIQPIPDNLMVGDYIEINGFCRGQEVIVELLTEANAGLKDTGVLPLRIVLNAGGPVQVMSQNRAKVQKQEHFVKNGIQDNLAFELCIYALEDGYDIKLNNETVCHVAHLVKLDEVGAISMDGDADFTSIEFKDIYGEDDEGFYPPEDVQPGFMRVQESRQSSTRQKTAPVLVRSSTRRSQRSSKLQSPQTLAKSQWETSADLTRPELDLDKIHTKPETYNEPFAVNPPVTPQVRATMSRDSLNSEAQRILPEAEKSRSRISLTGRKSVNLYETNLEDHYVVGSTPSKAIAGEAHRGNYMTLDDEMYTQRATQPIYRPSAYDTVTGSTTSLGDKSKKKRSSWLFGKSKKSGGSESDLTGSTTEIEKKKKGSIRNIFKRKKTTPSTSGVDIRQAVSMPDVTYPTANSRMATSVHQPQLYLGAGADTNYVRGPVPSSLVKEPAPQIAAFVAAQKALPEFENYTYTSEKAIPPEQLSRLSSVPPVAATASPISTPRVSSHPDDYLDEHTVSSEVGKVRKLKGTAPELADILIDDGRAGFDHESTLTGQIGEPIAMSPGSRMSTAPSTTYVDTPAVSSPTSLKVKGTAPEFTGTVDDRFSGQPKYDTPFTAELSPIITPVPVKTSSVVHENEPPQKLKGPAPQIASQLHDAHELHTTLDDDYSLSGEQRVNKPKDVVYQKPAIDLDYEPYKPIQTKQAKPFDEPNIDVDYEPYRPKEHTPSRQSNETLIPTTYPAPVAVKKSQPQRTMSAGYPTSEDDFSDVSSVHSDQEFYLEVGRSTYYMERKKSLARYRSKRSTKKSNEARRSMGFPTDPDSAHSSISSLKPDDPVLIPRKRMGTDKTGVDSWLNGHSNTYSFERSAERPRVYAAPPVTEPVVNKDLIVDEIQMKRDDYTVELPLPLRPGRSARIIGQFISDNLSLESCSILLTGPTGQDSTLMLKLWSNWRLNVYEFVQHKPVLIVDCGGTTRVPESEFTLELHNRNNKLAITVQDCYTAFVPSMVDPSLFTFIKLEPCDNALLSHLSVSNNLSLPLMLKYPHFVKEQDIQTLTLHTKLTAESKKVVISLLTEGKEAIKLVIDFIKDKAYLQFGNHPPSNVTNPHNEIPFVPEQIRKILVQHRISEDTVKLTANNKEVMHQFNPFDQPIGRIDKAQIEGDLLLLDAICE